MPKPTAASAASPTDARPAARHSGSGSRAARTTPGIASDDPGGRQQPRVLALGEPAGDRDEHAEGPDRRDDADRAERHRPVEGAERAHDDRAAGHGEDRVLAAQRITAGDQGEGEREHEAHRLA